MPTMIWRRVMASNTFTKPSPFRSPQGGAEARTDSAGCVDAWLDEVDALTFAEPTTMAIIPIANSAAGRSPIGLDFNLNNLASLSVV